MGMVKTRAVAKAWEKAYAQKQRTQKIAWDAIRRQQRRGERKVHQHVRAWLQRALVVMKMKCSGPYFDDIRAYMVREAGQAATTRSWGVGPVEFDVARARWQGWTLMEIAYAQVILGEVSRLIAQGSIRRHPEWNKRAKDGTRIFTRPGRPEGR